MPRDGPTHERIDPHEGHNLSESLSDLFLREKNETRISKPVLFLDMIVDAVVIL